jgi:hypothetical protein
MMLYKLHVLFIIEWGMITFGELKDCGESSRGVITETALSALSVSYPVFAPGTFRLGKNAS